MKRENYAFGSIRPVRTITNEAHMAERLKKGDSNVESLITSRSMVSVFPVFSKFLLVRIHKAIDFCSMFYVELLSQSLSLGISKLRMKSVAEIFRDDARTTNFSIFKVTLDEHSRKSGQGPFF